MKQNLFYVCRQQAGRLPFAVTSLLLALAACGCYTSMYAFRKAFTAGIFQEITLWGVDYKVWLVIVQVFGYMLSKFYGIRFISERAGKHRALKIMLLIGISWLALLGFALVPAPYNIPFLFINGFPLGMIWGLVFAYLEGRRTTEFLGAVMSTTLVFASGLVKTVARILMDKWDVSVFWMPFYTGLLFVAPLLLCTFILEIMPKPDAQDIALRTERLPMNRKERQTFLAAYLPGLTFTIITYLLLTILRDIRDNFEVEIWADLGIHDNHIYAKIDSFIAIIVLISMSLLILVKDNFKAFSYIHGIIIIGCLLISFSTWCFITHKIDPIPWMTLAGLGVFMAYIPYNAIYFERFIAAFRQRGNIGFVMYLADSVGYLGSVSVLLVKELGFISISWGKFFIQATLGVGLLAAVMACGAFWYFSYRKQGNKAANPIS